MADVGPEPPKPNNWRELMKDYIYKLIIPADFDAQDHLYSRAKIEIMQFVPVAHYDDMLKMLLPKFDF